MNATTQTVEAGFDSRGRMVLTLNSPGSAVEHAGSAGLDAGQQVVSNALTAAVGADLQRAGELLREVRQANRVLAQHDGVLAAIDRKQAAASGLLFGPALDARSLELEKERDAAADKRVAALGDRSDALQELQAIRDKAVSAGVKAVARTLTDRRTAAAVERRQAADRLTVMMSDVLTQVLKLDGELGVLGRVSADDTVQDHLEEALPAVFGEDGLTPAVEYDWREEMKEREDESRRRGWDRPPPRSWPGDDAEND